MPSAAFFHWQTDRMPRLAQVETQCAVVAALAPPNPTLLDENLRGYAMVLSTTFRDIAGRLLRSAQICRPPFPTGLIATIQAQFSAELLLHKHNPTLKIIRADFERFGFILHLAAAHPANPVRITHLDHLNYWRNTAAHQRITPPPPPIPAALVLADLQNWRVSCDGLATSLDDIMHQNCSASLALPPGDASTERDQTMEPQNRTPPLKAGTWVKIRNSGFHRAQILSTLGRLGRKVPGPIPFSIGGSPDQATLRFWKNNSKYCRMPSELSTTGRENLVWQKLVAHAQSHCDNRSRGS